MKRQLIDTILTLIWRHDSALLEDFSVFWTTFFSQLCRQSALTSVFWLMLFFLPSSGSLSLYRQTALQAHWTSASVCTASNIYMKYEGGWHAKQPNAMCEAGGVFIEDMQCWLAGFDTVSHSKPEMQIVDTPFLASLSVCFLFFIIIILIQKRKEALKQAAFNMSRHSNIYPCRIQLRFPPFFFSRSRSPKALKLLLSFFHNNVPDIINLSQCSFRTMLCVRSCQGGAGGEDRYKWHQSQAGSSLGLPSDAAFYSGGSPSC